MKYAERIVILVTIAALIGGVWWMVSATLSERAEFRERVANGEFERSTAAEPLATSTDIFTVPESDWRRWYPVTYTMRIGDVEVEASVADTLSTRIKGLSDTPYLPAGVVKLFAFGVPGSHSIWMKDMNYAIDIIWADEDGTIVHIVEDVSPDTYDPDQPSNSDTFESPVDAWFVIETYAGFVAANDIERGDTIALPQPR